MIATLCLLGIEAVPVSVEVDTLRRLPCVVVVGLPGAYTREAAEVVRSAILSTGYEFPRLRVVVNFAPADLRKGAAGMALPMAAGILARTGQVTIPDGWILVGDLSLSGEVRPVRGGAAMGAWCKAHGRILVCPPGMAEVAARTGADVRVIRSVSELRDVESLPVAVPVDDGPPCALTWADVRGHVGVEGMLREAAATRRPVLLVGPPGCGKTMIAARCPELLGAMTEEERGEVVRIHDAAGLTFGAWPSSRPFRAPHHTVSVAGLTGNAAGLPGEATLAHGGVLFLDEFGEFPRMAREALRVVEDGRIVVQRSAVRVEYPARAWIIAACNPGEEERCAADPLMAGAMVVRLERVPASVLLGGAA